MNLGGFPLESVALDLQSAQFDLTLMAAEAEGGIATTLEYNTDLFDAATVDRPLLANSISRCCSEENCVIDSHEPDL